MKELVLQRIIICGETFSNNLGDVVIADSLFYLLTRITSSSVTVEFLDLSLREGLQGNVLQEIPAFSSQNLWERLAWKVARKTLPTQASTALWWFLKQRQLRYSLYKNKLSGASAIIVGGGQLLADNQFDFPLKVYGVSQCAKELGVPVFYYGCGVGYHWSDLATYLFKKALLDSKAITVRDTESFERISERIPEVLPKLKVTWDPAVYCAEAYGISKQEHSKIVGLAIAEPAVLKRHSRGVRKDFFTENYLLNFWVSVAHELTLRELPFRIFTNGAPEDQLFAQKVANSLSELGTQSDLLLDRPINGKELVQTISSFQVIVAFRLHACIISHSLFIPAIGLKWDSKIESFFEKCGRERYCLEISNITPVELIENIIRAVIEESELEKLNFIKSETLYGVKDLVENISKVRS